MVDDDLTMKYKCGSYYCKTDIQSEYGIKILLKYLPFVSIKQ